MRGVLRALSRAATRVAVLLAPPGSAALLLLAVSAGFYGELLVLYPKAFRRRYAAEMRQDFSELVREGLHDGGTTESVRVLAQAFWEPVLTALKERSTQLAD